MTFHMDNIETGGQSATATVCENAALFGATPERDEFDTRDVWDADEAVTATREPILRGPFEYSCVRRP